MKNHEAAAKAAEMNEADFAMVKLFALLHADVLNRRPFLELETFLKHIDRPWATWTRERRVAEILEFLGEDVDLSEGPNYGEAALELFDALQALTPPADLGEVDLDDEERQRLENARAVLAKWEGKL